MRVTVLCVYDLKLHMMCQQLLKVIERSYSCQYCMHIYIYIYIYNRFEDLYIYIYKLYIVYKIQYTKYKLQIQLYTKLNLLREHLPHLFVSFRQVIGKFLRRFKCSDPCIIKQARYHVSVNSNRTYAVHSYTMILR